MNLSSAPHRCAFSLAAILGVGLVLPLFCARATTYTWDGGGADANVTTGANWQGNTAPPVDGSADVVFTDSFFTSGHTDLAPNLSVNFLVDSLTFAGGSSFTLGSTNGRGLDIGAGGLNQNSTVAQTITVPTFLTANQTWTFAANAGALNFTGNGLVNLQNNNLTLAAQGSDTLGGTITGSGGLVASGPGTMILTGNNTFGGGVTLAGGTLSLQDTGAIGTGGTISFTGGTLQYSASNRVDYSYRFSTAGNQAFSIDTNGQNVTFATSLDSSGGSLTKLGAGTLTLTTTNTYSGTTSVGGGTLAVNSGGNVSSGPVIVGPGGTLAISGTGSVTPDTSGSLTVNGSSAGTGNVTLADTGSLSTGAANIGNSGAGTFTQTGGSFTTNGKTFTLGDSTGSSGTYSLSGSSSSLSTGTVTIGLSGTGSMTQSAGSFNTNGGTFSLGYNAGASGTYSLTGGTLTTTGVYIGNYGGAGTFNQSGGTFNNTHSDLQVAYYNLSPGSYTLSGGTLTTGNAYIGSGDGAGTFSQSGGTFTVSYTVTYPGGTETQNYTGLVVGYELGSNGTYNLSGTGSLSTIQTIVGAYGTGTFNQSGGTFNGGDQVLLAYSGDTFGSYTLTGGSLSTDSLTVGSGGVGTFTQTGGTTTVTGAMLTNGSTLALDLGSDAGSVGTYSLQGGTLSTPSISVGDSGVGTLTLSGGTATVAGTVDVATASGGTGTVNLDTGGLLQVRGVDGQKGTSTFNFNGGTLQATASSTTFFHSLSTANVQTGGAKIDTNSFNATVAQALLHDTTSGAAATDGGLTKLGAGTLTLTGTSTYTGTTTVNAGTLTLDNNPGASTPTAGQLSKTSAVAINSKGTLLLSGSASVTDRLNNAATVVINGGGTLGTGGLNEGAAPTAAGGVGGAVGVGALTLASTGSLSRASIDFGTAGTGSALVFSSLSAGSVGAFVSILDYTGTVRTDNGAATNDRLLFASDPGFTAANLANWQFSNDAGVAFATGGIEIAYNGYFEIVPVPEPATWLGGALLLAAGGAALLGRSRANAEKRRHQRHEAAHNVFAALVHFSPRNRESASGRVPGSPLPSTMMNPPDFHLPLVRTLAFATLLAVGTAPLPSRATTYTWDGGGSHNDWKDGFNWAGNTAPVSSVDTSLIFAGTTQLTSTQDLANPFLLNALTFDNSAGAFVLGGNALDFSTNSAGTLPTLTQNSASAITINNALILANNLTVGGTGNGTLTLGGALGGASSLTMAGSGTTLLTGTNTYTGGTTFAAGTLDLGSAGALGSSGTLSFTGGTLQYSAANTTDYSARFSTAASQAYNVDTNGQNITFATALTSSGGSLTKAGAGTLTLAAANPFNGLTTITAGALLLSNANALENSTVNIAAANSLAFAGGTDSPSLGALSGTGDLALADTAGTPAAVALTVGSNKASTTYSGVLSGAGSLTKTGTGTLILTGNNTYTGTTTLSGGTITSPGSTVFTGNTLQVGNGGTTGSLGSGDVVTGGSNLAFDRSDDVTLSNSIDGTAGGNGAVTKLGADTLTFTGAFSPLFTNVNAGTLILTGSGVLQRVNVNAGATLVFGPGASYSGIASTVVRDNATVNFTGGNVSQFMVTLNGTSATANGNFSGGNANLGDLYVGSAGLGTLTQTSGAVNSAYVYIGASSTGQGTYTLSGGTMTVAQNLTLGGGGGGTGTINLNGGTLYVGSGLEGGQGGTLNFNGGALEGSIAATQIAAYVQKGGAIFTEPAYRGSSDGNFVPINAPLLHDPSLGSTPDGGLTLISGALELGANNTYTGTTTIGSNCLLYVGYGGIPSSNIPGNTVDNGTLNFDNATSTTYAGQISGPGTVIQSSSTLVLTGNNTYTGGTNIARGVLQAGSAGALGTTGTISFTGGTLQYSAANTTDYSSRFSTADGQLYSVDTNGQNVTLASPLSSNGSTFAKMGAGTLTLPTVEAFTGIATISGGAVALANPNALQNVLVNPTVNNGLIFPAGHGTFQVGNLIGGGNVALTDTASGPVALQVSCTGHGVFNGDNRQYFPSYYGVLSGSGSLTVANTSMVTDPAYHNQFILTQDNTYTGGTTISASSTLQLGVVVFNKQDNTTGSVVGNIVDNGTLILSHGVAQSDTTYPPPPPNPAPFIVSNVISGTGGLTLPFTTPIVTSANSLYPEADTVNFSESVILTGNNSYTGGTYNEQTLQIGNGGTSGTLGTGGVANYGTLIFDRADTYRYGGIISASYSSSLLPNAVIQTGAGTLILGGANVYNGSTAINAGTLLADNTSGSATGTGAVSVNNSGSVLGGTGAVSGSVTVASGAKLRGGDGSAAIGALTLGGNVTLNSGSIVELALGPNGQHSSLARSGSGTWSFASGQTFNFINLGAQAGVYDNLITGLASDPGGESSWTITNANFSGTFLYDGQGDIDLNLTSVPEPATWLGGALLLGTAALGLRRRQRPA